MAIKTSLYFYTFLCSPACIVPELVRMSSEMAVANLSEPLQRPQHSSSPSSVHWDQWTHCTRGRHISSHINKPYNFTVYTATYSLSGPMNSFRTTIKCCTKHQTKLWFPSETFFCHRHSTCTIVCLCWSASWKRWTVWLLGKPQSLKWVSIQVTVVHVGGSTSTASYLGKIDTKIFTFHLHGFCWVQKVWYCLFHQLSACLPPTQQQLTQWNFHTATLSKITELVLISTA